MTYQENGAKVKTVLLKRYDKVHSRKYRERSDELNINSEDHKLIYNILKDISHSFGHKISVLDIGCGTGRYFYCLRNVERLVGVDISPNMLEEARNPIRKKKIKIQQIDLICANIFEIDFPNQSFNFIYSIGVLGEYSPFNLYICKKLFDFLKPGGKLFFTVVDISSKPITLKKRVLEIVYDLLPPIWKKKLDNRWEINLLRWERKFYMTYTELKEIIENSKIAQYEISRHVSTSPIGWKGAHYHCIAVKDADISSNSE